MHVRARRFACTALFTRCTSVCFQFSLILTEVRAKLGTEAYKTSKSPLWLSNSRNFSLETVVKKKRKLEDNRNRYTLALVFRRILQKSIEPQ